MKSLVLTVSCAAIVMLHIPTSAMAKDVSIQQNDIYLHQQTQPPLANPKVGSVTVVTNPNGSVGKYVIYDNDGMPQSFGDVNEGADIVEDMNSLRGGYQWDEMEISPTFEEDLVLPPMK